GSTSATAPIFVSNDGGDSWTLRNTLPSENMTADITHAVGANPPVLYAGILKVPGVPLNELKANDFLSPATMTLQSSRADIDQPFVRTAAVASGDRVYVGLNDFDAPDGRTATVDVSLDGGGTYRSRRIETRSTLGQNGPSIRPAVARDHTVYVAYFGWRSQTGSDVTSDVVVVRGDGRHLHRAPAPLRRPRRHLERRPPHGDQCHEREPGGGCQRHGRVPVSTGDRVRRRKPLGHAAGAVARRLRDTPGRGARRRAGCHAGLPVPAVSRRLQRPARPRRRLPGYILSEQRTRFGQLPARCGVSTKGGFPDASAARWLGRGGGRFDRSVLFQCPRFAMTTNGRREGPTHTRTAILLAVALALPGVPAVAQMSRAALVKQSDIIFIGTVTQVGAVA